MNDLEKLHAEVLGKGGWFAHAFIAKLVFGTRRVTDREIAQVRRYLIRKRILVRDGRNGRTSESIVHAERLAAKVRPNRRKAG